MLEKLLVEENKKRQADYIAPLQPLILAAFRPWGGSAGAGRVRPACANIRQTNQERIHFETIGAGKSETINL